MKNNLLLQAAVSGLIFASGCSTTTTNIAADKTVAVELKGECHGINACHGQGECGGAGHSCAGKNTCKGAGWLTKTQKDCEDAGGKFRKHMS